MNGMLRRLQRRGVVQMLQVRYAYKRKDTISPDPELLPIVTEIKKRNVERESFPGEFATDLPRGRIHDKKPFRIYLEAGQVYQWCICGSSKGQPMCDGSHKRLDGTAFVKTRPLFRPLSFSVETSDNYYLCNCKRTGNPPFCDGTHKRKDIQDAVKS